MVASKKIHCVICNKKCSGNVLRYQDQYYHKQCFELEQSQGVQKQQSQSQYLQQQQQQQPQQTSSISHEEGLLGRHHHQHHHHQSGSSVAAALDSVDAAVATANQAIRSEQQQPVYNVNQRHSQSSSILNTNNNNNINTSSQQDYTFNSTAHSHHSLAASGSRQQPAGAIGGQQQHRLASSTSYSQMPAATTQQVRGSPSTSGDTTYYQQQQQMKSQTIDARSSRRDGGATATGATGAASAATKSATLPHSSSVPANGFLPNRQFSNCAGCQQKIKDGQALIALDLHWHVWCFKCSQCQVALHGEYVAKEGKAYCEKDYQRLFGVTCVYCKRYITGKVLQAGEAHHFHPSCARCSKCGDPFVPGEEMYLQGEVTWHPRCGPGPNDSQAPIDELALDSSSRSQLRASRGHSPSLSSRSHSRSASPFSFMSRQYGRSSPGYADSEAVGDLSRVYTISYLNADPTQGYLRRPIEPSAPKSPQFSRPTSVTRGDRSRSSSRSHLATNQHYSGGSHLSRERSVPRGMYSVLSSMSRGSQRARSPSMMNEEAIHLAQYPSGQKPSPDAVPKIERDDFPAPPFPYTKQQVAGSPTAAGNQLTPGREPQVAKQQQQQSKQQQQPPQQQQQQQRSSRPKSREIVIPDDSSSDTDADPQLRKEEQELSKIANGIGKIFLQTLKEREKLRAWKRANLDPRNASRTPSATRELPTRLRYDNPTNASPSRDMDRPRPWEEEEGAGGASSVAGGGQQEHSPTRTRSSLGRQSQLSPSTYGYKVVQSNRSTPKPGYGLTGGPYETHNGGGGSSSTMTPSSVHQQHYHHLHQQPLQYHQQSDLSFGQQQMNAQSKSSDLLARAAASTLQSELAPISSRSRSQFGSAHLRRSMPNVNLNHLLHLDGPPKLYPYHLLATSNYRLPPDVDRCHLERHLSNEEFQYIFHCDRLDFYRLPEWKRNELKRRAKLF